MKTPQLPYPELAKALGIPEIYLKREDLLEPYGSHKGRSIPHMIKNYTHDGARNFVISSSGNAAITAIHALQLHNQNNLDSQISLTIFVGKNINEHKLDVLNKLIEGLGTSNLGLEHNTTPVPSPQSPVTLIQVDRPLQSSTQLTKETNATLLRQSTDDSALFGYHELAHELAHIPNLEAVFIQTSSGTTAQGLAEGLRNINLAPQIHVVQTLACHPIVNAIQKKDIPTTEKKSLASAIVDKIAYRAQKVAEDVTQSNGNGWIPDEKTIAEAISLIKKTANIDVTGNGALGVAGIMTALKSGKTWSGAVVAIVTGQ